MYSDTIREMDMYHYELKIGSPNIPYPHVACCEWTIEDELWVLEVLINGSERVQAFLSLKLVGRCQSKEERKRK